MQQLSSRKSPSHTHKNSSPSLLKGQAEAYWRQLYNSNNISPNTRFVSHQDTQSIIEKLIQTKQIPPLHKVASKAQFKPKRQLLVETQERIFHEVIELVGEIDQLRSNMYAHGEEIKKMQIEHPDVEQQVRFHGYSQKLNPQQCSDLQDQNQELLKKIEEIESKQISSLEEVLHIEQQKYQDLKMELTDNGVSGSQSKIKEQRIRDIKKAISQLEGERSARLKHHYPQFDQLKRQNEQLRHKTIQNLKNNQQNDNQEESELLQYLRSEEQNRNQFMEELNKFKIQFKRLKAQNESIKQKLNKRRKQDSKQNSGIAINRSKITVSKQLQVQSNINKGKQRVSKLGEYESFLKHMQSVKK